MYSLPPATYPWAENTENMCFLQGMQHNCNIHLLSLFSQVVLCFHESVLGECMMKSLGFFKKKKKRESFLTPVSSLGCSQHISLENLKTTQSRRVFLGYTATTTFPVTRLKGLVKTGWIFSTDTQLAGKLNLTSAKDFKFWKVLWRGWKVQLSVSTTGTCPCFWNPLHSPGSLVLLQPAGEHWSLGAGKCPGQGITRTCTIRICHTSSQEAWKPGAHKSPSSCGKVIENYLLQNFLKYTFIEEKFFCWGKKVIQLFFPAQSSSSGIKEISCSSVLQGHNCKITYRNFYYH